MKKRRDILRLGAAGLLATPALATSAQETSVQGMAGQETSTQGTLSLKMANVAAVTKLNGVDYAQLFLDRVQNTTQGAINIEVETVAEDAALFDAVSDGSYDMIYGHDGMWAAKNRAHRFFHAVPFGLLAEETIAWLGFGSGQDLWDGLGAQSNVKPIPAGINSAGIGGWFRAPVSGANGFGGLKVAAEGHWGAVLARLGADVIGTNGQDILGLLKSGRIDGAYLPSNNDAGDFALAKASGCCLTPGVDAPSTMLSLSVNLDRWNGMTDLQRVAIDTCAKAQMSVMLSRSNLRKAMTLRGLNASSGTAQLIAMDDALLRSAFEASSDLELQGSAESPMGEAILDSYKMFRGDVDKWTLSADASYYTSRAAGLER